MEVEYWSNLLPELIEIISRKLTNYADYVRFRAVCVNWRSNLSPTPHYFQFPLLMLPPEPHIENRCGFFSLMENKVVHQLNISNTHLVAQAHCCGSSQGWLLLIEDRSPNLFLFNPLTGIQIHLPPLTAIGIRIVRDHCIHRFSLSSKSPTSCSKDYIVVAIVGTRHELAFCKKGDEKWTLIKDDIKAYPRYRDVIYYKGLFYAVDVKGYVTICDFSSSSPLVTTIDSPSTHSEGDDSFDAILYLVDSFGELLLVNRFLYCNNYPYHHDNFSYQTEYFEVFRLDTSETEWVEVESFGDCTLFLGTSSSLCLSANDFPATSEGNCIYFTRAGMHNLSRRWKHDSGVFNLGDGSIKALPCCSTGSQMLLPPLLWLTPSPC